jgi:integrase
LAQNKPTCVNLGYGSIYNRITRTGICRWYLSYRDGNGKRVRHVIPHAHSQEQAVRVLLETIDREFHGKHEQKPKKIGFKQWANIYLRDYSRVTNKSWKDDEYRMKALEEFYGEKELRKISLLDVQRFRKSRLKAGNAKSTVNRYISLLKRMMNIAILENYLESNPVKVKKFSEQDRERTRVISEDEEAAIMEHSSPQLKSFLIIALATGMRTGEIYRLSWKQIDLQERMITIERTKSGRLRHIPINQTLFQELVSMRSRNARSQYLFHNPRTGKPVTSMKKAFHGALGRAGLTGIRIYDCRHTAATRWIRSGVDVQTVKELLGHADITTTQRYLHSNAEAKREAVDLLDSGSKMRSVWHTSDTRRRGERSVQLPSRLFSAN